MNRSRHVIAGVLVGVVALGAAAVALVPLMRGGGKIVLGGVEDVELRAWGVRLPARIDTGAATSSLRVKDLTHTEHWATFVLPAPDGDRKIRLHIEDWRRIRSSDGIEERRPVVEMDLVLGGVPLRTQVTLDDRSRMAYPMLVGRRTLAGRFVVDPARAGGPGSAGGDAE